MAGATPPTSATPQINGAAHVNETLQASGTLPQSQLGVQVVEDDKSALSYQEIAMFMQIQNEYPVLKAALEVWDSEDKLLSSKLNDMESRKAHSKNHIYNIVALFAVSAGVVLGAVSQLASAQEYGKTPLCGKIWSPILLTLFGTFVTCVGVLDKFAELRPLEHSIQIAKQQQAEAARRGQTLRRLGPEKFRFKRDASNSIVFKNPKSLWRDSIFMIPCILVFTAIFILSYFSILCDFWVIRGWNRP